MVKLISREGIASLLCLEIPYFCAIQVFLYHQFLLKRSKIGRRNLFMKECTCSMNSCKISVSVSTLVKLLRCRCFFAFRSMETTTLELKMPLNYLTSEIHICSLISLKQKLRYQVKKNKCFQSDINKIVLTIL